MFDGLLFVENPRFPAFYSILHSTHTSERGRRAAGGDTRERNNASDRDGGLDEDGREIRGSGRR